MGTLPLVFVPSSVERYAPPMGRSSSSSSYTARDGIKYDACSDLCLISNSHLVGVK